MSETIQSTIRKCRQVARMKTTVLLTGETGTGKGIFARYVHQESDRKNKPFVNVNCAGLPANLIESELFGREKVLLQGRRPDRWDALSSQTEGLSSLMRLEASR